MADASPDQPNGGPGNRFFSCTLEVTSAGSSPRPVTYDPCPPTWKQILYTTTYTLTYNLKDEAGFFAELDKQYGIQKSWVKFDTTRDFQGCTASGGGGGGGTGNPNLDKRCDSIIDISHFRRPVSSGNIDV